MESRAGHFFGLLGDFFSAVLPTLSADHDSKAENDIGVAVVISHLRDYGYETVSTFLYSLTAESDGRQRPLHVWMNIMDAEYDPFAFERYRGLVPDEEIRRAYNYRRNRFGNEGVGLRVRQLAGVIDDEGSVMPGYRLLDNGCIVEAVLPDQSS